MRYLSVIAFLIGLTLISQSLYMDGKAVLAQQLISHSWTDKNRGNADHKPAKPWPWADTRPVAKLAVPRLKQTMFVMQDSSGESLAFGPGHIPTSALPGASGHVAIAGHRDTHFSVLRELNLGDTITTENYQSQTKRYRVIGLDVINSEQESLKIVETDTLTLITCYPFEGWIPGGPLRYIVTAIATNLEPQKPTY